MSNFVKGMICFVVYSFFIGVTSGWLSVSRPDIPSKDRTSMGIAWPLFLPVMIGSGIIRKVINDHAHSP